MSSLNKEMISCGLLFGCIEVVGHCGEPFMPPQVGTHLEPALQNSVIIHHPVFTPETRLGRAQMLGQEGRVGAFSCL